MSYIYYIMEYDKVCVLKKKRKKMSKKAKLRICLAIFLLFILSIIFYYFKIVCPIIVNLSQEKVRAIATSTISEVVGDVMSNENTKYENLVKVTYSGENKVELIEIDTVQVNILIREITKLVQEEFNNLGTEGLSITLGTFTGIPFLFGYGPSVDIKLVPVGTVSTVVKSNFQTAGINQTLHRLNFVVNSNIGMVLPGMTKNFTTELEVLLCENIIVGEIPNVYLQGSII